MGTSIKCNFFVMILLQVQGILVLPAVRSGSHYSPLYDTDIDESYFITDVATTVFPPLTVVVFL